MKKYWANQKKKGEKVPLCFQEPPAISKAMKKYWANQKKKGEKVPLCFQEN
jgi:hypothetical protein